MCGIIGIFNSNEAQHQAALALEVMESRGTNACNIVSQEKSAIGHCLHAMVGYVEQPLQGKGILSANCEIYNWKELAQKYKITAKNDADLLLHLLDAYDIEKVVNELDGVYAFIYQRDGKVIVARDLLGVKPLWCSHTESFALASEKKALERIGYGTATEVHPRQILVYNIHDNTIERRQRPFFEIKEKKESKEKTQKKIITVLEEAVLKRVPEQRFGLLFSGGVDSTFIACILKKHNISFTCYTAALEEKGLKGAEDLLYAQKVAKELGLKLKAVTLSLKEVPHYLEKIVPLIEDTNVVKVGVALPFYLACEAAKKDGCRALFSGLGSEELFAGYQRHKNSSDINKECISGLIKLHERDLYRDDVVTMAHSIELRLPFLDTELVTYALTIPGKYKIDAMEKQILREAALAYGVPKDIAHRKKRAAQYGSNFDKALEKLSRGNKSKYLKHFYPQKNLRLGALVSGGKDSIYALHIMHRQNYDIACMMTITSKNPDSFMFHTPAVDLVSLQSEAMNIPFIGIETKGEKEVELEDLKKILKKAKEKYSLDGIITGALFSNYQRDRIERICDDVGLKIFSPLWHMDQETEMRQLLSEGFIFMFTKVAAEGLDASWLGRVITEKDVDKLVALHKKYGLNIAGEGGEFESLVLKAPLFTQEIQIEKSRVQKDGTSAVLIIDKARAKI